MLIHAKSSINLTSKLLFNIIRALCKAKQNKISNSILSQLNMKGLN